MFEWFIFYAKWLMYALLALCLILSVLAFIASAGASMPGVMITILTCGSLLVNPAIAASQFSLFVCGVTWLYTGLAMILPVAVNLSLHKPENPKAKGMELAILDDDYLITAQSNNGSLASFGSVS